MQRHAWRVVSHLSPIGCRIVKWVTTANGAYTPPTQLNSTQLDRINSQHVQFPNFSRQSSWASCEFNTHRRRDSTRQLSRVGVGGVYWALDLLALICRSNYQRAEFCRNPAASFPVKVLTKGVQWMEERTDDTYTHKQTQCRRWRRHKNHASIQACALCKKLNNFVPLNRCQRRRGERVLKSQARGHVFYLLKDT